MNKREILAYFRTFFMTLLVITLAVVIIAWVTKNSTEKVPTPQEIKEYKEAQIEILIDQYKYKQKLNPKNYVLNVKLGLIYENLGRLNQAEEQYKKAIENAPYMIFEPTFLLAELYTKERKFNQALFLINKIKEYPDSSLISSKAIFYSRIAEELYKEKLYSESIRQYLNSLYYQEKTTVKSTNAIEELPKVYLALANEYIKKGNNSKGMFVLAEGIRITESPELMYRLAIVGMDTDPESSLELLEEVAKKDPTIIDYDKYRHLLLNLIKKAEANSNTILAKSYAQKYKLVSKFAENNIIAPDDFQLEVFTKECHTDPLKIRTKANFEFAIRNNSSLDASKLYVQVKIFNNYKLIQTTERRIAAPYSLLKRGRSTEKIRMSVAFLNKNEFMTSPDIKIEVAVKKNERIKRTRLGEFYIDKD